MSSTSDPIVGRIAPDVKVDFSDKDKPKEHGDYSEGSILQGTVQAAVGHELTCFERKAALINK